MAPVSSAAPAVEPTTLLATAVPPPAQLRPLLSLVDLVDPSSATGARLPTTSLGSALTTSTRLRLLLALLPMARRALRLLPPPKRACVRAHDMMFRCNQAFVIYSLCYMLFEYAA